MRRKLVCVLTAVLLCLTFALSACGGNANERGDGAYHTVTFDSQGGSAVESQQVLDGNPARAPASPARENYDFEGWYRSADGNAALWDFAADRVNGDLTLYAHWTEREAPVPTPTLTFEQSGAGYVVTGDEGQAAHIVIPAEHGGLPVMGIGESAFAYSRHTSDILSVTIPDSVTEIGLNAFHNQDALVSVKIGTDSDLQKIGNNAFSGNSSLKAIYLPAGLSELGDSVFNNCGGLESIAVAQGNTHYSGAGDCLTDLATGTLIRGSNKSVIPQTVTKIGVAAFRRATITTLTIPTAVTSIEKYAVSDSAITKIVYEGTSAEWNTLIKASSKYWNMGNREVEVVCSDTALEVLVAYFSATGNTKKVAGYIADVTDGKLYEIVPQVAYTEDDLKYYTDCRADREQGDPSARPLISGSVEDMAEYDVIFLGYPIWHGQAPKIIYTFLESYDFSGKTVVPFCTSGSSGIEGSLSDLKAVAGGANWLAGRRFSASTAHGDVENWVNGLWG